MMEIATLVGKQAMTSAFAVRMSSRLSERAIARFTPLSHSLREDAKHVKYVPV